MISTSTFDAMYYALALSMIALLATTAILARFSRVREPRNIALGTGYSALGALVTVVGAVALTALIRSSSPINGFLYQQLQFSIAYVGFAMFLFGLDRGLLSTRFTGVNLKQSRIFIYVSYFFTVAIASIFLFDDATYRVSVVGSQIHVAQQTVFWIPLFLALDIGTFTAFYVSLRKSHVSLGRYPTWFGVCSCLILLGTLRESTIIPSSGDPLTDLFVAFLPFVAGSLCIVAAVLTIRRPLGNPEISAVATAAKN